MTLLELLVTYCAAKGVLVGDGVDAFRDFMPDAPDNVVVFHEYSGDHISQFTTAVHRSVQVKVRNKSSTEARAKAIELMRVFKAAPESLRIDFTDAHWGQVYIRQAPFKLSQDTSDRTTYCFNLGITTNIVE